MPTYSVIPLVRAAAAQDSLAGIQQMLRVVTEEMRGWGTLIWMASAGSDVERGTGRLFVLAYWVSDKRVPVWHEISFDSMAGRVLKSGKPDQAKAGDERIAKPTPKLILDSKTQRFCLAPMQMVDGSRAVLEVYKVEDEEFKPEEVLFLEQMAAVLPVLYANLADRVGVKLINDVDEICRQADPTNFHKASHKIVDRVNQAFSSLEVSMFLRGLDDEPGVYSLVAYHKTWPGPWSGKSEYRFGEGATGYVLQKNVTVRVQDLSRYQEDVTWLEAKYPGLKWDDSLNIQDRARDHFHVNDPESSPPIRFVCAPIRTGVTVFGAIRCSGRTESPYYFDEWQARYLDILAVRIGAWWGGLLKRDEMNREIRAWETLMNGFDQMNRSVQKQLSRYSWDEGMILRDCMKLAHEVIPYTDNSDVRFLDAEKNELVTVAYFGRDWDLYPQAKNARYPLSALGSSASHLVSKNRITFVYNDIEQAPYFKRVFTDTRKMILAPIDTGDPIAGILCIRSKSPRPFPPNVRLISKLLGQQLGLYHSLAQQIRQLQIAERSNRDLIETQAKTLGDVHHQVKTPIINAHRAAQSLINNRILARLLRPEAERVRGLCSNVARVVRNMGMFADLAAGEKIRLKKTVLNRDWVLQNLREVCEDHQRLIDPQRQLTFRLEERSFEDLALKDKAGKLVEADSALLEQCINNLVDNAAKYSYDSTDVWITGGIQAKGTEFFISVANEGFEVKAEEVQRLKQRGYRSVRAIRVTGEGSGIGLWIVDEIMKAHGGRLAISPTQNGITDFRLVFPVVKGADTLPNEV